MYVESNFVLEISLGQPQWEAAESILARAELREIELAFPSFSVSEPFFAIMHRARSRKRISNDLNEQVRDLRRSHPYQQEADALAPIESLLAQIGQQETTRLVDTVQRLLTVATVIQIDVDIFRDAVQFKRHYDLSEQDAIIYSSVINHLTRNAIAGPHLFINRNWKDFDDPDIHAELGNLNCAFVRSFTEGALRLAQ